jgi:pyrimidine-nucleoside phosphorylase
MIALKGAIDSGAALKGFRALIEAQGGDGTVVDNYNCLPRTEKTKDIVLNNDSPMFVEGLDARSFGDAACILGAGRASTDSIIDPAVGIELLKKVGQAIQPNEAIARIHYQSVDALEATEERLEKAIKLSAEKPVVTSLIIDRISHEER